MGALKMAMLVLVALAAGQSYKCDWSVVAVGGGNMAGGAYECGSTVGQTVAGRMTGTSYWALAGFWQTEEQTGVREQTYSPGSGPLATWLYAPSPTPAVSRATIRYSLAVDGRIRLRVHDLTGRVVRTLVDGAMRRGQYCVTWDGTDDRCRKLTRGVYILRLGTNARCLTRKLVID